MSGAVSTSMSPDPSATAFDLRPLAQYPLEIRLEPTEADRCEVARLHERLQACAAGGEVELPAFPAVAARILNLLESPEPDLPKLVSVISQDAAISAQVLRTAGSMAYSRGVEVTSVRAAAVRLGLRAVANIAIAAATRALLDSHERDCHDSFRERWRLLSEACAQTAFDARWLSLAIHRGSAEEAFLGGLLHDIGKVVALRLAGLMVQQGELPADVSPVVLELLLETSHVELGADLATFWDLPGFVSYLCLQHHHPAPEPGKAHEVLHLVRVASALGEARHNPLHRPDLERELFWSAAALGLDREGLQCLAQKLAEAKDGAAGGDARAG